jgi:hypothetical protein
MIDPRRGCMGKFWTVLGFVFLLGTFAASNATATPSQSRIRVEGQAELFAPTGVLLTVSYKCPEGPAQLGASVGQEETNAFAFQGEFLIPVTCTGKWETVTLNLGPPVPWLPPFNIGHATASASIYHGSEIISRERNIRIVS